MESQIETFCSYYCFKFHIFRRYACQAVKFHERFHVRFHEKKTGYLFLQIFRHDSILKKEQDISVSISLLLCCFVVLSEGILLYISLSYEIKHNDRKFCSSYTISWRRYDFITFDFYRFKRLHGRFFTRKSLYTGVSTKNIWNLKQKNEQKVSQLRFQILKMRKPRLPLFLKFEEWRLSSIIMMKSQLL